MGFVNDEIRTTHEGMNHAIRVSIHTIVLDFTYRRYEGYSIEINVLASFDTSRAV